MQRFHGYEWWRSACQTLESGRYLLCQRTIPRRDMAICDGVHRLPCHGKRFNNWLYIIRHNKVKGIIRIRNDNKQCCPLVTYHIQFHLIIAHDLTKLCNVEQIHCLTPQEIKILFAVSSYRQLIFFILT